MPIDNELYHDLDWWDEESPIHLLRTGLNPLRFSYFADILKARRIAPEGRRVLDVGCGGGFLSEEFARLGFQVIGIDPSQPTLEQASRHARDSRLAIEYRHGSGEKLEFGDSSFDVVVCCDVLEHVRDLARVISEIGRVLAPGGLFFYDTINRTPLSKLVMIKLAQDWKATAFVPKDLHDWKMFIRPEELRGHLKKSRLQEQEMAGMEPGVNPIRLLPLMMRRAQGRMKNSEFGRQIRFRRSKSTAIGYMGFAQKQASAAT